MCTAVYYTFNHQEFRTAFADSRACLPVRKKQGDIALLPWGRRKQQAGKLPLGGWARLDAIYGGHWDRWRPLPVKLDIRQFMEINFEGARRWFDVTSGKWIQGLIAHWQHERRVYVVTITPELEDSEYERWPRILSAGTRSKSFITGHFNQ
ncbi:MAG: hypothetical protein JAZ20_03250 [Candidatus Thiodiazotropha weberae]|nr:hypothetical protein [Candidatus Thiodiazotropha lotti]MCG8010401.1 hypothetical protein [Candidatus Thiodiazotropha lotti]MCG8019415.1 hypothetical protein [Candidatus Thiodiazotropha lotti]MCW4206575.1 hypothetical protein [Candidatus Thiodiazotropha lotti]MCW4209860.1 hypothetical protein [Candidatus Thiodiazotropha lotti]